MNSTIRVASLDSETFPFGPGQVAPKLVCVQWKFLDEDTAYLLGNGDVGLIDARGELHVLDRRSDLIVSGGENVYPAEVEAALREHPAVVDAAVAAEPDPAFGARVAAWIVLRAGARSTPAELASFCRERLAGYKIPRSVHFVPALPRSESGKLLRRALAPPSSAP